MKKRLEALKKDQNGFTLVELIVVLVILAILAALLVPALLGYIDKAREAKYFEEARSIYTAIQVINDERYAKGTTDGRRPVQSGSSEENGGLSTKELNEVNQLVDPTELVSIDAIDYIGTGDREQYTIKSLTISFKSQDDNTTTKTATMTGNGTWEMD